MPVGSENCPGPVPRLPQEARSWGVCALAIPGNIDVGMARIMAKARRQR
jgi:hypothetical protein